MTAVQRPRQGGEQGFTLAELLVSITLLSLVAALLLGAVGSARQIVGRALNAQHAEGEIIAAQAVLRDRIEHLHAIPQLNAAVPLVDLRGDEQGLSFYAPPLHQDAPGQLHAFRLLRMATGDLVLFSAPSLTNDVAISYPSLVGWKPTRLLAGVDELELAYMGPGPTRGARLWQRVWYDQPQPPQLLRVRVRFPAGDTRTWPDLVVRPRVTANTACRIDNFTYRCREGSGS
ncbi:MAG: hypothetical protein B7Z08_00105 [Sphingomonadales bacterium 32-68-7]|nr:MAG: hypothetical protein B7Z33_08250 [Sphingomonadales bacterium 12-68-11]OYX10636.1 MAG: hypothetical protein B7Z08_00105 [Sphingomonadales bacterium 32-68-7]